MGRLLHLITASTALFSSAAVPRTVSGDPPVPPPAFAADLSSTPGAVAPKRTLIVEQAGDGLFYVEAKVNGAPVQFVVDTGSSVVILSAGDAARAGVGADAPVAVETAGGAAAMRRARIDRVVLAGRMLSSVDAAIVNKNLNVSLLGQSALSQLGSVTFKGRRLELE